MKHIFIIYLEILGFHSCEGLDVDWVFVLCNIGGINQHVKEHTASIFRVKDGGCLFI
jgi:hypothetical protein